MNIDINSRCTVTKYSAWAPWPLSAQALISPLIPRPRAVA